MVESIEKIAQEKDPYLQKLADVKDESLQSKLSALFEMG